jgi:hypothetical protein
MRRAVAAVAIVVAVISPSAAQAPLPAPTVINVDTNFGSLAFNGTIERFDLGREWEFRPHLELTFQNSVLNRTDRIELRYSLIIGSLVRGTDQPVKILHREEKPIVLTFTEFGQTKRLPELSFRVSKDAVADANRLLMGVSDGKMVWGIPAELR